MAFAHAFLGNRQVSHTFRFNPDSAQWSYKTNTSSQDTIGGRVVQLLSTQISGLAVDGRAGSRGELQRLADNVKAIMNFHVRTQAPVQFKVPSRKWDFLVYVQGMPQIGWDVSATSYPYSFQFAVEEDLTGVKTQQLGRAALSRLAEGIGYNPAVHGGNAGLFTEFVDSVLKLSPDTFSSSTAGGGGPGNPNAEANGPNTGSINSSDTPQLKTILEALKKNGMLRPGGSCANRGNTWSEHNYCNARDLMIAAGTAKGKQDGDAIANFLEWHLRHNTLPIHCIIWWKRILSRESLSSGWKDYDGASDHTDHVHVSGWPSVGGYC